MGSDKDENALVREKSAEAEWNDFAREGRVAHPRGGVAGKDGFERCSEGVDLRKVSAVQDEHAGEHGCPGG